MSKRVIQQSDVVMVAALADYQKKEMTTEEIAAKFGVSTATLTVWAKKTGTTLRKRGRKRREQPSPRQLEIIKLAQVYTYDQVGDKFGMAKQSIHRIVKRWRGWSSPKQAPFQPGDMLLWRGKKFTVVEANIEDGTLVDSRGKYYKNFAWNGGRIPKKVGVNPRYVRPTAVPVA